MEGFDFDGDGDVDQVFRNGNDIHGNSDFAMYRNDGGCPVLLGTIGAFAFDPPRCVQAPVGGRVCRMTANRRMHHDDYQEYFWVLGPSGFEKDGAGRYIPGRDSKRP